MSHPAAVKPVVPAPEVPVVSGGPLDPNDPSYNPDSQGDPNLPPAPTPPVTPPAPAAQKLRYRGREFNSEAELDAYVATLHTPPAQQPAPAAPTQGLIDGKPIEEVMFNDPGRYHQHILDEARRLAREDMQAVNTAAGNEKKFWDDLYAENPDLKDQDRAVKSVLREKFDEFAKLPVSEARTRLALEARQFVSTIRQGNGTRTTELSGGSAPALGASGAPAPRVTVPEPSVNFIDQVKKARRRG